MAEESFSDMFEKSFGEGRAMEGLVVKGAVVSVERDMVLMDVGLKSEGYVPLREFGKDEQSDMKEGSLYDVFVERFENKSGEVVISRARARREEAWIQLEQGFEKGELFEGQIVGRVRGGYTVDIQGASAFMPNSQADLRPVHDPQKLINQTGTFEILRMNRLRGNIIISRRTVLERERDAEREKLMKALHEDQILEGTVKNITDFGAFIDIGGGDGLLHITDISWKRIYHPSDVLSVGEKVTVKVIRFNQETGRINLGIKQLQTNPWEGITKKYPLNGEFEGIIRKIMDYGVFVELEDGVEGLVHISELAWGNHRKNDLKVGDNIKVMIIEVNEEHHRISLSHKRCLPNPWQTFADTHKIGSIIETTVYDDSKKVLILSIDETMRGIVLLSDVDWDRSAEVALKDYPKGTKVKVKLMDVNVDEGKIRLSIKHVTEDPFVLATQSLNKGDAIPVTVSEVRENALHVTFNETGRGFIRKNSLAIDNLDRKLDRFKVGVIVDAMVVKIDPKDRRVEFSIKELELKEQDQAIKDFSAQKEPSVTLGDILDKKA